MLETQKSRMKSDKKTRSSCNGLRSTFLVLIVVNTIQLYSFLVSDRQQEQLSWDFVQDPTNGGKIIMQSTTDNVGVNNNEFHTNRPDERKLSAVVATLNDLNSKQTSLPAVPSASSSPTTQHDAQPLDQTNHNKKLTQKMKIPAQCSVKALRPRHHPSVVMTDKHTGLQVVGAAKGGATVTTQLVLRHLGLMEEALSHHSWIHKYRMEVFLKDYHHTPRRCKDKCYKDRWLCIKIVRSVVDRAVSSYIHTLKHLADDFPDLVAVTQERGVSAKQASFQMFLQALERRAAQPYRYSRGEDHFMPQADKDCGVEQGVHHVPLEALHESMTLVNQTHGVFLDSTGFTSSHYIKKNTTDGGEGQVQTKHEDVSGRLFDQLFKTVGPKTKLAFPYDAFFENEQANAQFCQLYCRDIFLYAEMCSQSLLRSDAVIQHACVMEQQRILHICGNDYFQQSSPPTTNAVV